MINAKILVNDATFELVEVVDKLTLTNSTNFSLNVSQSEIAGVTREGNHLVLTFTDEQEIYIEEYFTFDPPSQLFISDDGDMERVDIDDINQQGALDVTYVTVDTADPSAWALVFVADAPIGILATSAALGLGGG